MVRRSESLRGQKVLTGGIRSRGGFPLLQASRLSRGRSWGIQGRSETAGRVDRRGQFAADDAASAEPQSGCRVLDGAVAVGTSMLLLDAFHVVELM